MTATVGNSNASPKPVVKTVSGVGQFKMNHQVEHSQNVKVAVRLRPLLEDAEKPSENRKKNADKRAWNIAKAGAMDTLTQKGHARKVEGRTVFHFDQVFDEDTKTPLLYKSIARPMVQTVLKGKHATIFAYGQTGSGKTFTMQGDGKAQSGQAGIIQLVASDLFRFMHQGEASKRDFVVKVSYFEIYNEKIRDLLSDDVGGAASHGTPEKKSLNVSSSSMISDDPITIRTNANGEIVVNVIQNEVSNVDEVLELLIHGNTQRVVAATDLNNYSSRSHAVFRLSVESREIDDPLNLMSAHEVVRVSDFNLVDLAGSESLKQTNNSSIRQREGASINKSLLALITVVQSLSLPEKKRPKHINYRDSKLTRILQPHLSGNAEMAILCCASPSKAFVEETRSTLKFAAQAKLVEMKPKVNEVMDDGATIKKLQHELADALKQLEEMKKMQLSNAPVASEGATGSTFGDSSNDSLAYEDMDSGPRGIAGAESQHHQHMVLSNRPLVQNGGHRDLQSITLSVASDKRSYVMPASREFQGSFNMDEIFRKKAEHACDSSNDGQMHDSATSGFQLDTVDSDIAKTAGKSHNMRENLNSVDSAYFFNLSDDTFTHESEQQLAESQLATNGPNSAESAYNSMQTPPRQEFRMPGAYNNSFESHGKKTVRTEDESLDGPEASYGDASLKFGSQISTPDTIRGASAVGDVRRTRHGSVDSAGDFSFDGQLESTLSWDTMNLKTSRLEHVGQPLRALQSLTTRDAPIPDEVTVINTVLLSGKAMCLTDQLKDADSRIKFLEGQLDSSDEIIEATFRDLERARLCIHDLVHRNVEMTGKIKEKRREDTKEAYMAGEVVVEQYWILKGSIYVSLFFFLSGGYEYFLASVFFIWLALETTLTA